jgi:chromosome segregation ATPase
MGLFGSSALKRKIVELTGLLETAQERLAALEVQSSKLESSLSSKDESFRVAKEGRQKAEKKLDKLSARSMSGDKKLAEATKELERVKSELAEYRNEILSARAQSDRLQARLARQSQAPTAIAPVPPRVTNETDEVQEMTAPPVRELTPEQLERKTDRRVARLQEQLDNERSKADDIKARALRAEQTVRDADRKRASNAGKNEAKLREVEHALQSERKAYKILQLQYQGLLEAARGQKQLAAPTSPSVAPAVEAAVQAAVEPVVEATAEPVVEAAADPAVEVAVEPAVEVAVESAVEVVVENQSE